MKEIAKRMKRQGTNRDNRFAKYASEKNIIFKTDNTYLFLTTRERSYEELKLCTDRHLYNMTFR